MNEFLAHLSLLAFLDGLQGFAALSLFPISCALVSLLPDRLGDVAIPSAEGNTP